MVLLIFPTVSIITYVIFASEFFLRVFHDRPIRTIGDNATPYVSKNMKVLIFGLGFNTLCIFIRYVALLPTFKSIVIIISL